MGRLIDAEALKANVLKWLPSDPCGREEREFPFETDICVSMLQEIDEAPTVDAVPVRHGRWIDKSGGIEGAWNYCSVCGEQAIDLYDFCPNCGADMRKDVDDGKTD